MITRKKDNSERDLGGEVDSNSQDDFNEVFQKNEEPKAPDLLADLKNRRKTVYQQHQEHKLEEDSHVQKLEKFYAPQYHSFKTPVTALFYFFRIPTKTAKKIIELLEGCDNKKDFRVDLKEFCLRYCPESKNTLLLLIKLFEKVLHSKNIKPGSSLFEVGEHFGSPINSPREEAKAAGTNNNNRQTKIEIVTTSYFTMICFLCHFMSLKRNDYVIYVYWLLTLGRKIPLVKKELEEVLSTLYRDQLFAAAAADHSQGSLMKVFRQKVGLRPKSAGFRPITPYSGGSSSSKSGKDPFSLFMTSKESAKKAAVAKAAAESSESSTASLFGTYLATIKDEYVSSGQLRLLDTKLNSLLVVSLHKLTRKLFVSTYPQSFWKENIIRPVNNMVHGHSHTLEEHYQRLIKEINGEEIDLCDDFKINKERKTAERELRKYLRVWQNYLKFLDYEQQSMSEISGIDKSGGASGSGGGGNRVAKLYRNYLLPYFIRCTGLTVGTGAASVYPEEDGGGGGGGTDSRGMSGKSMSQKYSRLLAKSNPTTGEPSSSPGRPRASIIDGIKSVVSPSRLDYHEEEDYDNEEEDESGHQKKKKQQKISFKKLIAVPQIPTKEELDLLSHKTKKKAYETVREVDALLEEIDDWENKQG
jgi:hypothetical protein